MEVNAVVEKQLAGVVQATIREKRSSNGGPSPLLFGVEPIHDP